jgi:hypothetical protein
MVQLRTDAVCHNAAGGTAQEIGGPLDKEGAVGKQFTTDGSIGRSPLGQPETLMGMTPSCSGSPYTRPACHTQHDCSSVGNF